MQRENVALMTGPKNENVPITRYSLGDAKLNNSHALLSSYYTLTAILAKRFYA